MSEWQPIETAPKDGTEVLVWALWIDPDTDSFGSGSTFHKARIDKWVRGAWWRTKQSPHMQPTHWMPLPEPPK